MFTQSQKPSNFVRIRTNFVRHQISHRYRSYTDFDINLDEYNGYWRGVLTNYKVKQILI